MQVTFTFSSLELQRQRCIKVTQRTKPPYAIPPDPLYDPVHRFFQMRATGGFPFNLVSLLHATAVKKLAYPANIQRFLKRSLLVTGGLYLALNPHHRDLEMRELLGDFASGFSHDFGVGLTLLVASEIFDIPLDELNPIAVRTQRALDYAALIQKNQVLLQVEAKGVTSNESRTQACRSIYYKKQASGNTVTLQSGKTLISNQVIKIGIIVQASCKKRKTLPSTTGSRKTQLTSGLVEIIDPQPNEYIKQLTKEDFLAGKYWHFAGIALFAGLNEVAEEFALRAKALSTRKHRELRMQNYHFDQDMVFYRQGHKLIGVQWQLSDLPLGSQDIWLYQATDRRILQNILANEIFPESRSYLLPDNSLKSDDLAESVFPDGSYFGIGLHAQKGLHLLVSERED